LIDLFITLIYYLYLFIYLLFITTNLGAEPFGHINTRTLNEIAKADVSKLPILQKTEMMNEFQHVVILHLTDPDPNKRPSIGDVIKEFKLALSKSSSTTTHLEMKTTNETTATTTRTLKSDLVGKNATNEPAKYVEKVTYEESETNKIGNEKIHYNSS
jgi:hypothetical protein